MATLTEQLQQVAARLHEEAEARIAELQARHTEQLTQCDAAVARLKQEAEGLSAQLQQPEVTLQTEHSAHEH